MLLVLSLTSASISNGQDLPAHEEAFELENDDRVVFLGDGFIEAAQRYGYIELALTTRWPGSNATFRNIGWAGDTVDGDARRHFTDPPDQYERLISEVTSTHPTVLFVGYGSNVPFDGDDDGDGSGDGALTRFEDGLNRLLDDLVEATGARIVLLSPPPHEIRASPVPEELVSGYNEVLQQVADVVGRTAGQRGHRFADVFSGLQNLDLHEEVPITTDGVSLNDVGYYYVAHLIEEALGLPRRGWSATIGPERHDGSEDGASVVEAGASVIEAETNERGGTFTIEVDRLPVAVPASISASAIPEAHRRQLTVPGLRDGSYELAATGRTLVTASSTEWSKGIGLASGPDIDQAEEVRRLIIDKNRLYFHQFRPQNSTYLVGFRAYEQGQNAKELSHFGPLIDQKELEIGLLSVPQPLTFKLVPTTEL
jgi:hypothetical protein